MNTRILKKTEVNYFGFFMLLSVVFCACNQAPISAEEIIAKTIETHGGFDNWKNIKTLSFDKTITLFNPDGSIEKELKQHQSFQLNPELKGVIQNLMLPGIQSFSYNGVGFLRTVNDSIWNVTSQKEIDALHYSFFASHYVICQPFELLSETATLSLGESIEVNGKSCFVVNVSYEEDLEDVDKWSYIIDAETYELIANKVVLSNHTSWIENLSFDTSTGFKFNAHRKSYRLNEAGEKTYLRAEYFYSNFKVHY